MSEELRREIYLLKNAYANMQDNCNEAVSRAGATEARLSEAVKVLEPFAEAAECLDANDDYSSSPIWEHAAAMNITVGDLRRVRRFLATLGEET